MLYDAWIDLTTGRKFHCIYCVKRKNQVLGYFYATILANSLEDAGEKFSQNANKLCSQLDCDLSLNVLDDYQILKVKPNISFNGEYIFEGNAGMALEYTNKQMCNSLTNLIKRIFKH